jgi:hypothetical protein
MSSAYDVAYSVAALEHLGHIDPKFHPEIRSKIMEQVQHDPFLSTRNRKPLRPNPFGVNIWELRFGPGNRFRVLYRPLTAEEAGLEGDEEPRAVKIVAIGTKSGNSFFFGGEEIDL